MSQLNSGALVSWLLAGLMLLSGEVSRAHGEFQISPAAAPDKRLSSDPHRSALVSLLEDHAGLLGSPSVGLEPALVELRLTTTRDLFEIFCLGGVPPEWRSKHGEFLVLDADQLKSIERSLLGLPLGLLRVLFGELASAESRVALRQPAFQMLGKRGTSNELALMLALATPLGSRSGVLGLSMRRQLEASILAMAEREPRAVRQLGELFGRAHEGLQPSIVRVLAQLRSAEALGILSKILGVKPELDPYVLNAIARCARNVSQPIDPRPLERVRRLLQVPDAHTALAAMGALGPLEDFESIPFLIDALAGADGARRELAWRALREVTGLDCGSTPASWQRWHERELAWWRDEVPELRETLLRGDLTEARSALGRILAAKLNRHQLSELLLLGLRRSEPEVLALTCLGLSRMGSRLAISPLILLLDHAHPAVAQAAHAALMSITKMKISADAHIWSEQARYF